MSDKKTLDLLALASIPLIVTLGNSMLIPVLPVIEKELHISSFQASLIITVYSVVAIFFIPIAGYLSDQYGRKKIIIPSLIITGIGGAVSGLAAWFLKDSYWLILVGRFLQGIGAAGAFPVILPAVGDLFRNEEDVSKGLGLIETSNTIGKVLSPIIGAFLAGFIWYVPFLAVPVLCLTSALLVAIFVKTPNNNQSVIPFKKFLTEVRDIFKNNGRWLLSIFLVGCIIMLILFAVLFYLSELLEMSYQVLGVKKGLYIAIPLFALSTASFFTGKKIGQNKVIMKWLSFSGMSILAIVMVFLTVKVTLGWFLLLLFVGGIGIGLTLPCLDALITEGIDKENRGTITSLYSSMRFIGVAAGPPLFAYMMDISVTALFWIFAIVAFISVFFIWYAIKPEKENGSRI